MPPSLPVKPGPTFLCSYGLKLKIDENLPGECPSISRQHGFEADSVAGEGLTGSDDSTLLAHARA